MFIWVILIPLIDIPIHTFQYLTLKNNKDENVHRFALSALRGELLERERKRDKSLTEKLSEKVNHRFIDLKHFYHKKT